MPTDYAQKDFILLEDKALKQKLSGLAVPTMHGNESVDVWFRRPQTEVREVRYPFITIDLINVMKDSSREHRNRVPLTYTPYGAEPPENRKSLVAAFPLPYLLDYQITTWTRFALQSRQLLAALLRWDRIPHRDGLLEIPEDGTYREMYTLAVTQADTIDEQRKRIFRNIFTVRVETELFVDEVGLVPWADRVVSSITRPPAPEVETVIVEVEAES